MTTPSIFISYRRADTGTEAILMAKSLREHFGENVVFFDHDTLEAGSDWKADILKSVKNAAVFLILYGGEEWLGKEKFSFRILDTEDMVRLEVETALQNEKALIVPVIFRNAETPPTKALPENLKEVFSRKNHYPIRRKKWDEDLLGLIKEIEKRIPRIASKSPIKEDAYLSGLPVREKHIPPIPYKSLNWFEEKDARIFFGRGKDIRQLYNKLNNDYSRIITFFGQSGAGKSSLLHAGLLPRLPAEWTPYYQRRTRDGSVVTILENYINWLLTEKPLRPLLILDQLEEIYTNPYTEQPDEAERLPELLQKTLSVNPNVRIILGLREDRWAAVENLLNTNGINFLRHYLSVLDQEGIREAVAGILEDRDLADCFRGLSFAPGEEDLALRIAHDLMSRDDSRANAAPLLQFILRRMWDEASANAAETPLLSWELYDKHRRASMLDLLDKQLEELHAVFPEEVTNGLTLDLLRGFVTEENTAGVVTEDTLLQNYTHLPPQLIKDLCLELGNKYLLTSFPGSSKTLHWRLAHDALAPAVLRRFTESDAPGQRARRIVESKKGEIGRRGTGVLFSEPDLEIIQAGKNGMPIMSDALRDAIDESATHYADARWRDAEQKRAIVDFRCEQAKGCILQLQYNDALISASFAAPLDTRKDELTKLMMEIAFFESELNSKDSTIACLHHLRQLTNQDSLEDAVTRSEALNGVPFRKEVHLILESIDPDYFKLLERRYFPDMVPVVGGTYQMGAEKGESKGHRVTIDNFHIARTQVTWWQYMLFCRATNREMPSSPGWGRIGNHPVVNVNWYDAVQYANWVSERRGYTPVYEIDTARKDPNNKSDYDKQKWTVTLRKDADGLRLPTEAEWEFAARGGKQSKGFEYAGSDDLDEVGWYSNNAESKTHPVAEKKANELGIYDMSGNVWEWCGDWYGDYPSSPPENPAGPASGSYRVLRGGAWDGVADGCRVAYRSYYGPVLRSSFVGFRPARTVSL
ncbi:MAG: Hercynine oxygenase [Saprospiraceae bacterium]|nr:Hercynine oxygenase [Saprospiraceae bacterium]